MTQPGGDERIAALERALADSEAIRAAVMGASLDCVVTIDAAGHIVDFNRTAERTFGWDAVDLRGRELAEVLVPADLRDVHRASLARHVETGEARILDQTLQLRAVRRSGEEFPVELKVTRVDTTDGPLFVGVIRDVTDHDRAVRELADIVMRDREASRRGVRAPGAVSS